MSACPADEELLKFAAGALPDPAPLEQHFAGCPACKALIAHVAAVGATVSIEPGSDDDVSQRRAQVLASRRAATPYRLASGARVGRYTVLECVGTGGMGEVYAAYDPQLDRRIAIKLLKREDGGLERRLLREAQAMARLDHPNVVPVYDVGEHDGQVFVAMAFVAGATLRSWLDKRRTWREILDAFLAAGEGLAAAHAAGIVHRDFKPDNVLVDERGLVRVTDFRLATTSAAVDAPVDGKTCIVGTPAFMAPEQIRGDDVDARADVFAFCVALWSGLYRGAPFAGARLDERLAAIEAGTIVEPAATDVPRWLRHAIEPGLRARRDDRPASMRDLIAALSADPAKRRRRVVAMGAAGAAVATAAAVWLLRDPATAEWRANVENLQFYEENSDQAAISPDGKLIAYPSNRDAEDGIRIYVEPLAGGPSRVLTPPEHFALTPHFRADGSALTYIDQSTWTAYEVPLAGGGPPRQLRKGVHDIVDCGGRWIVNEMSSPGCPTCQRLIVVDGDRERELVRTKPGEWVLDPICDPANLRVAYGHSPGNTNLAPSSDLWIVPIAGGAARQLTNAPNDQNRFPTWSSDHSLVFSSKKSGNTNLWELSLDDGSQRRITEGEGPDYSVIATPDLQRLVFNRDITSTPLLAVSGGKRRRITHTIDHFKDPHATADGSEVVAVVTRAGIDHVVAVATASGEERAVGRGQAVGFSLDESEILFSPAEKPTSLLAVARRDLAKRREVAVLPGELRDLVVGPDGTIHIRIRHSEALEAWRVTPTGIVERDAPAPWCQIIPAPRGGWIAATKCHGLELEVHLIPPGKSLDDPDARVVGCRYMTWDRDGTSIVMWSGGDTLRYVLASQQRTVLGSWPHSQGLSTAADGTLFTSGLIGHVRRHVITNFGARPPL